MVKRLLCIGASAVLLVLAGSIASADGPGIGGGGGGTFHPLSLTFEESDGDPLDGIDVTLSVPGNSPVTKTTDGDGWVEFTFSGSIPSVGTVAELSFPEPLDPRLTGGVVIEFTAKASTGKVYDDYLLSLLAGDPDDYFITWDTTPSSSLYWGDPEEVTAEP